MGKQEGLILLGIMDAQGFAQDNRVYSSMGIAPTIRAENHNVQIMDGHNYDKTRQDKTRQDKTRQDKTRQDNVSRDTTSCQVPAQIKVVGSLDSNHESFESANRVYDTVGLSPTIKARDFKDPAKILVPTAADKVPTVKVIGQLNETFESQGRVYDKNGLSPTLRCFQGGGLQPKIIDEKPVVMDMYNEKQIDGDVCGTITAEKGNAQPGNIIDAFNRKVLKNGISPTITTRPERKKTAILPVTEQYRIRKLTPRECWRLMGYTDEDFDKAASVNSNSQLYKQAGNAIVKQVLMAIFSQMNISGVKPWNGRTDAEIRELTGGKK